MALDDQDRLRIDPVEMPHLSGYLGLCACPGVRPGPVPGHDPHLELLRDIDLIREFGACGVVSLVEERELMMLGVEAMPAELRRAGLWWIHLPIADMGVPGRAFELRWEQESRRIHDALAGGGHVVMHCFAGLGRTGTIAARLLIERGMEPEAAILRVRTARPGAIQTRKQERYVLKLTPGEASGRT